MEKIIKLLKCIFVNDVKQNDIKIKFNYKLNIKLNIQLIKIYDKSRASEK